MADNVILVGFGGGQVLGGTDRRPPAGPLSVFRSMVETMAKSTESGCRTIDPAG